ncbi:hypothetical protein GCM10008955_36380 [Deinococcus malanensis]|uniref:Uncharacterized protein n=1 Tax=Deinococcus malanensis TaxID=1706855 RepID=A0ABQ2F176_9DEIO|nr:hypothetical protein [Deinococcus malanensis]GGK39299.1 hypothetical protein GCM10008955_36380 [Deinococcus malanensis]
MFDRLSLPMPLKPGEAEFSDWDGIETDTLDGGREYTLHVSAGNDPHNLWLSLNITGERRDWLPHQRSTRRPWKN